MKITWKREALLLLVSYLAACESVETTQTSSAVEITESKDALWGPFVQNEDPGLRTGATAPVGVLSNDCKATLIGNRNTIVTAFHCVSCGAPTPTFIRFPQTDGQADYEEFQIVPGSISWPSDADCGALYDRRHNGAPYDIAVAKLVKEVPESIVEAPAEVYVGCTSCASDAGAFGGFFRVSVSPVGGVGTAPEDYDAPRQTLALTALSTWAPECKWGQVRYCVDDPVLYHPDCPSLYGGTTSSGDSGSAIFAYLYGRPVLLGVHSSSIPGDWWHHVEAGACNNDDFTVAAMTSLHADWLLSQIGTPDPTLPPYFERSYAVYGNGAVNINDRARIVEADGTPAQVLNAGIVAPYYFGDIRVDGSTIIGADAVTGDVVSVPGILLRERATLSEYASSRGSIVRQNNVTASGLYPQNNVVLDHLSYNVTFPEYMFGGEVIIQPWTADDPVKNTLLPLDYSPLFERLCMHYLIRRRREYEERHFA